MSKKPKSAGLKSGKGPGVLFHLAAAATVAFIVTVLALVATLFADPDAPVNVWLNQHATKLLAGEVLLIVVFGVTGMARDQRQQEQQREV